MAAPSGSARTGILGLDHLPSALMATIMTKLDIPSILSLASTCTACRSCAAEILSFLPNFHLPDIAPSIDLLGPLLPHCNPYLRSLKVDCTRLDDSSLDSLLHPSLQELYLRNCTEFSGRLLSELGRTCRDLRFLYLSSVAEKRGRSVDVLHLEEMLSGCTQLETLILMFDVSVFLRHSFARVWALASPKLISLEIEYISSVMMTELLSMLPKLKTLLLDGCDLTDAGLSYLSKGVMNHLVSLSVRGCRRLTDRCISSLFDGNSNPELRELDLSNLPNISDAAVLLLARSRILISELRMRQCPLIGDTSIMALASMQVDENTWCGSSLRLLDIYNCGGITQLAFRWLKKPYFPRLRWLGVTGSMNRDVVEALARSRPYMHVTTQGEELGTEQWEDAHLQDYDDVDEFEEWLLGG
ncbi:F-box/LRR-repeat protein 10-like, partial [Salvia splendens]|uniref:F-box/LRR-repeat protein 10-like n=1 Tax=Salvia splendens TaxID=180675 RepID=UPI001C267894